MVIQKNANQNENSSSNNPNMEALPNSWTTQGPKTLSIRMNTNMQTKQPITRQIAINTLAAMHRRFSLPGPVQPHSRPIAEFRASANKSLDMLRQTIQSSVTREIDQVIKKYLEKFFVPAVNNIRLNLGDESVSEDQVRAVCRAMLDATRLLYTTPPRTYQATQESNDLEASQSVETKFVKYAAGPSQKRKDVEVESSIVFLFLTKRKVVTSGRSSPICSPCAVQIFLFSRFVFLLLSTHTLGKAFW
ncbi:unnamed protein product [Pieris macdunnoughi]|uniref:DNTTIP1 dimerisation domain-containing protein n=1 Tax=Pieris macdunnoughi TaxID=345717 RepID=A0A821MR92_9NEOP|nr:unnamed protein product [Pieris macdunnoughi]